MELEDSDDLLQEFKGGLLQLSPDDVRTINNEDLTSRSLIKSNTDDNICNNNTKNRWSTKLISLPQRITGSWNKKEEERREENAVSLKPAAGILATGAANDFFTFRQSVVDHAIKECAEQLLDLESDGPLVGTFLLTEITLWDTDKERLLLLTPYTLVIIKYDFIALRRLEFRKIALGCVDTVLIGDLIYPSGSIIPHLNGFADGLSSVVHNYLLDALSRKQPKAALPSYFRPRNRNMRGVRLMWNNGEPLKFGSRWNPLNNNVPFCTFTSHPLFYHKDCASNEQRQRYDVEAFIESIRSTVTDKCEDKKPCIIHHKDILLESYVGIGSLIYNRNALGYFKVRGRCSF